MFETGRLNFSFLLCKIKKDFNSRLALSKNNTPGFKCSTGMQRHLHTSTKTHTHTPQENVTILLPLIPITPPSQEGIVSSISNMNKTSCYSFLDKHPPSARKQEGEATPSFGFPPAIPVETDSPDSCWARQSGLTLYKVSALPEAQDGTSKHKQNLLNT